MGKICEFVQRVVFSILQGTGVNATLLLSRYVCQVQLWNSTQKIILPLAFPWGLLVFLERDLRRPRTSAGDAIAGEAIILKNRAGVSLRIEMVIICESRGDDNDYGVNLMECNTAIEQVRLLSSEEDLNADANIAYCPPRGADGVAGTGSEEAVKTGRRQRCICRQVDERSRSVVVVQEAVRTDLRSGDSSGSFSEERNGEIIEEQVCINGDVNCGKAFQTSVNLEDLFEDCFKVKGLHFVHLNIRRLMPEVEEVRWMLKNCKLGILCLTETWLDSSITDDEIKVNRYNLIRKDRNRKGGGICVFIHEDINLNVIDMSVGVRCYFWMY